MRQAPLQQRSFIWHICTKLSQQKYVATGRDTVVCNMGGPLPNAVLIRSHRKPQMKYHDSYLSPYCFRAQPGLFTRTIHLSRVENMGSEQPNVGKIYRL